MRPVKLATVERNVDIDVNAGQVADSQLRFRKTDYGFFPLRVMDAELAARLIHSADERIPVEDLELAVSFMRHAAKSMLA